jgi:prepilin-type processing-associated H-X9-DG protein
LEDKRRHHHFVYDGLAETRGFLFIQNQIVMETSNIVIQKGRSLFGWSRIEALTSTFVLLTGMGIALSATSQAHRPSGAAQCLNNLRLLTMSWSVYADENSGELVGVSGGATEVPDWAGMGDSEWMRIGSSAPVNIDPTLTIRRSPLAPYLQTRLGQGGADNVFRCPDDRSAAANESFNNGQQTPRVRSYSMNSWMGGLAWKDGGDWKLYRRRSDITFPGPAQSIVFIGERADSLNDSALLIDMTGHQGVGSRPGLESIVDYPSFYHHGAASVSFADGHVELKHWEDPRTVPPFSLKHSMTLNVKSSGNKDVQWLQARATRLRHHLNPAN